ncbi:hypothetical protein pb186bvf_012930 [Paramecium bursaria]
MTAVYSGFSSRQLEQQYDQLVNILVHTLCKRLIKLYKNEDCNEAAFKQVMNRLISGLREIETEKLFPPKLSEHVTQLGEVINGKVQSSDVKSSGVDILNRSSYNPVKQQEPLRLFETENREFFNGCPPYPTPHSGTPRKTQRNDGIQTKNELPIISSEMMNQLEEKVEQNVMARIKYKSNTRRKKSVQLRVALLQDGDYKTKYNSFII